jgi:hypothetical protein
MTKTVAALVAIATLSSSCSKPADRANAPPAGSAAAPPTAAVAPIDAGGTDGSASSAVVPTGDAKPAGGRMFVVYDEGDNKFRRAVKEEGVFEQLVNVISSKIVLPRDLPVVFTGCGQINAFYSPQKHAIIMCDEILEYFITAIDQRAGTPEDKRKAILGALVFFFLHEVGHALVNELELPAVGREEDSADQVASLVLIGAGPKGAQLAGYGADAFGYILQLRGGKSAPFWDEHSLDQQRFYNIVCLIYGSDPATYQVLVDKQFLPAARAQRCPQEFKSIKAAWDKLLAPYQARAVP